MRVISRARPVNELGIPTSFPHAAIPESQDGPLTPEAQTIVVFPA
jgi:hypothetical protein